MKAMSKASNAIVFLVPDAKCLFCIENFAKDEIKNSWKSNFVKTIETNTQVEVIGKKDKKCI